MADSRMARRGSYAKGVAKREEILERALEVIAREGYRGASVKELAEAVGLSQAGLLHYFDSKEELFTEILRKRDEVDMPHYGPLRVRQREPSPGCARGTSASSGTTATCPGSCSCTRRCPSTRPTRSIPPTSSSSSATRTSARVFAAALAEQQAVGRDHRPRRPRDPRAHLPGRRRRPAAAVDARPDVDMAAHRRRSSSTCSPAARNRQDHR